MVLRCRYRVLAPKPKALSCAIRMLDYKARNAKSVETLPDYIVDDVLARVRALLD